MQKPDRTPSLAPRRRYGSDSSGHRGRYARASQPRGLSKPHPPTAAQISQDYEGGKFAGNQPIGKTPVHMGRHERVAFSGPVKVTKHGRYRLDRFGELRRSDDAAFPCPPIRRRAGASLEPVFGVDLLSILLLILGFGFSIEDFWVEKDLSGGIRLPDEYPSMLAAICNRTFMGDSMGESWHEWESNQFLCRRTR